jgi:hypothetical protein
MLEQLNVNFSDLDLAVMSKSLIVLGLAFVCSGLVWLLPAKQSELFDEERPVNRRIEQVHFDRDEL